MPFQKGYKKPPTAGMKKGQKTAKVQAWERLGDLITGALTEDVMAYIQKLPDDEKLEAYLKLLDYFKPRMQRSESKTDLNVNVIEMPQIIIKRD